MWRRHLAVAAALLIAVLLTFHSTLRAGFVFDDVRIVEQNPAIRSLASIPSFFANLFRYRPIHSRGILIDPSYRPVRFVSHTLDYQIFGLNAGGHHFMNLIYHAAVAFVVYLLLLRLGAGFFPSVLAAFVFALHPLNSEVACYVTSRKDSLCALLSFGAFLYYLRLRLRPTIAGVAILSLLVVLAMLTKEMAVMLPVIFALYEAFRTPRGRMLPSLAFRARRILPSILPALLLAAAFAFFKVFIKNPVKRH